jgi:hypothetical protein
MAETRTSRFGLVQWGVGTDSPSRLDFNEAFINLENRAAYDDGASAVVLPVTNVVAGRYAMVAPGGANKTLYRRSDGGSWDFAGGNTDPDPFYLRPYKAVVDGGPARSTAGLTVTHPDNASGPGVTLAYDGSISAGGTLRVYDVNDAAGGNLIVGAGASVAADPATRGRVHIRTRADGERGLVLRPHGTGAGPMLAVQTTAGSDVLTLDATGQLQQRAAAAFGGASVPAASVVAIAPTSGGADTNGLVLHGQAAPGDTKTILRILRQSDDSAALMQVGRDSATVGRLPWGSTSSGGVLAMSGRTLALRASGYSGDGTLWGLTRADISDPANAGLDEPVAALARQSGLFRIPTTITQALNTGAVNLTLKRYTDLTQRFLELHRMGSGESVEVVGGWDSEGRVLAGTRWMNSGAIRDARQSLCHRTQWNHGDLLNPGDTLTKVFTAMQCLSATPCDLLINIRLQAQVEVGAFSDREDGQQWFLNCDISINGGGYSFLGSYLFGGPSHRTGTRPINVQEGDFTVLNVPAGATFQIRTRVFVGGAVPKITTQAQFVNVQESIVNNYSTP